MTDHRSVGRPRLHDPEIERGLLLNAAFTALRDKGIDFTISDILLGANVSTRTFYRHFESKDSLLAAMYLGDAQKAADRLVLRLSATASSLEAVTAWVDEIFSFLRSGRRAERVMVLGSIIGYTSSAFGNAVTVGRDLLIAPLREAINSGLAAGEFHFEDSTTVVSLVAAAVMHAAGISTPLIHLEQHDQRATLAFVLRALGHRA